MIQCIADIKLLYDTDKASSLRPKTSDAGVKPVQLSLCFDDPLAFRSVDLEAEKDSQVPTKSARVRMLVRNAHSLLPTPMSHAERHVCVSRQYPPINPSVSGNL